MLIITADDFGITRHTTDSILRCYLSKAITSVSAMVFMEDSARAATLSGGIGLEVGLHLNFTLPFTAPDINPELREHQNTIVSYLARGKLPQVLYNPFLRNSFAVVFRSQNEEFLRLYGRPPDFHNGHHHMHLCANVLTEKILLPGSRVRRTFTFRAGEKAFLTASIGRSSIFESIVDTSPRIAFSISRRSPTLNAFGRSSPAPPKRMLR